MDSVSPREQASRTVIAEIAAERERQQSVEGWTAGHDAQHESGELATAAACYALQSRKLSPNTTEHSPPTMWPWDAEWWKPKDARRDLIRAGALIVAEIERLDRLAAPAAQQPPLAHTQNPTMESAAMREIVALYPDIRGLMDSFITDKDRNQEWDKSVRDRLIAWGMKYLDPYAAQQPVADARQPFIHEPSADWYLMMWRDNLVHRPTAWEIWQSVVTALRGSVGRVCTVCGGIADGRADALLKRIVDAWYDETSPGQADLFIAAIRAARAYLAQHQNLTRDSDDWHPETKHDL